MWITCTSSSNSEEVNFWMQSKNGNRSMNFFVTAAYGADNKQNRLNSIVLKRKKKEWFSEWCCIHTYCSYIAIGLKSFIFMQIWPLNWPPWQSAFISRNILECTNVFILRDQAKASFWKMTMSTKEELTVDQRLVTVLQVDKFGWAILCVRQLFTRVWSFITMRLLAASEAVEQKIDSQSFVPHLVKTPYV